MSGGGTRLQALGDVLGGLAYMGHCPCGAQHMSRSARVMVVGATVYCFTCAGRTCSRCERQCVYVQDGGDGVIKHTSECLLATAAEYDALAEQAKRVNTHDRPYYLRAAAEHRALASVQP